MVGGRVVILLGCILITEAELAARYDVDGDGVPWPDDCDDRDASLTTCDSVEPPPEWRDGEGDFGHDVALVDGGHALVGAPSEAEAQVDELVLRGPSSCTSGGDGAGWSVAAVGDLDGDGAGEALVGGPSLGAGAGCAGTAWLLPSRAWSDGVALAESGGAVNGEVAGDGLGFAVAATDLDGDGVDEILLGAPVAGAVYAFAAADLGPGASLAASSGLSWTAAGAGFGVRAAGDVDGNGTGDALVTTDEGLVVLGGALDEVLATVPGVGGCGPRCAAGRGDLDGDGHAELAVGDSANLYLLPGAALSGTVEATDVATSVLLGTAIYAVSLGDQGALLGEASGVFLVTDPPFGAVDLADGVAGEYATDAPGSDFGWALDGGLDLGLGAAGPDVAVGSPGEGRVYFFAGRD